MNQVQSGLFTQDRQEIPLLGVKISVDIQGHHSQVSIKQTYKNQGNTAIEATYLFPVQDGSAIHSFKALTNGKEIIGKVMERDEAFDEYDDAISDGHAAYLIDQERSNVLHASIGNLAPKQEVEIVISYVHALEIVDAKSRLLIPTVVAPKYVPNSQEQRYGMSETERWNSPRVTEAPYTLELDVKLSNIGEMISMESPSHPIKTKLSRQGATVELAKRTTTLDRDFILEFELDSQKQAHLVKDQHGKYLSVLYHVPKDKEHKRIGKEVIFMLDTSGSMQGSALHEATNALSLLLRQLDEKDMFNVIFFDSSFEMVWPSVQAYNQQNLDYALKKLSQIYASGGTEILKPFQHLMQSKCTEGMQRQIVLLTDGAVSNEQELIQLCRKHKSEATVFTFGLGDYVSESLVRGIAKATNGSAEFIHSGERIEPKVLRVIKKIGAQPHTLKVDWNAEVDCSSGQSQTVFGGDTVQLYAKLLDEQTVPTALTIHLNEQKEELALTTLSAESELGESTLSRSAISSLWARRKIEALEAKINGDLGSLQDRPRRKNKKKNRDERLKEEIISLGIQHQLMSQFTSFIAVEKRDEGDKVLGGMELKSTPLLNVHNTMGSIGGMSQFFGTPVGMARSSMRSAPMSPAPMYSATVSSAPQSDYDGSPAPIKEQSAYASKASRSSVSMPPSSAPASRKYNVKKKAQPSSTIMDGWDQYTRSRRSASDHDVESASSPTVSYAPQAYDFKSEPDKLDRLFIALNLQQANGLFRWSSELEAFFVNFDLPDYQKYSDWELTKVVIQHIEAEYQEHSDLWSTAVQKAKAKLQSVSV